jgi:hypothetical protein
MAVMNAVGKIVMECVVETKANMIVQCIDGLRGDLYVTFEEGISAAWLYDFLKPHVTTPPAADLWLSPASTNRKRFLERCPLAPPV